MRNKIIVVNAIIVAIVGVLAFVMMRASITSAASNTQALLDTAKHSALGASARLQVDGLKVERWLTVKAAEPAAADPLNKADPTAAGAAATQLCDAIVGAAKTAPDFEGRVPSLVLLTDANGITIGRNGSDLRRKDDLGATYPVFKAAIQKGQAGSDVWSNKVDQVLASYAPVKNDKGQVVGALVIGIQLGDELGRVADSTTGRPLVLAAENKDAVEVLARSSADTSALDTAATKGAMDTVRAVIDKGHAEAAPAGDIMLGAAPLESLGDGKSKAIVASSPNVLIADAGSLATPILGVMALGIILVVIGGWLLGSYISAPIARLEEGLLAIINGQTDKRFQLEHAELGGLSFRIDQLLNQLLGVEEDTSDEEGRISRAPSAAAMEAAVGDEGGAAPAAAAPFDANEVAALKSEPAPQYYARIYREYIAARKAIGQPVDQITEQAFQSRIQSMESDSAQKGKPVRYKIQSNGREVVFLAVPIG
ncbi:MAG TPA: hypothetical protein VGH28_06525 [Polyangiaceae bacterium]|jgi:hypothetical protein